MAIIDNDLFTQPNPSANSPRNNPSLSEEITNLNNEMNSVEDTLVQGYVRESASVSYSSSSSFTISGDKTDVYTAGRIVRFSDGTTGIVSSSSYSSGTTTVNITNGTVPSNLSYVDISLQPKGGTNQFLKASGSDINTGTEDAKIVTPKAIADSNVVLKNKAEFATNDYLADDSGNELIKFTKTSNAVNEIKITNNATNNPPIIEASGGDTNISMKLAVKGTGSLIFPIQRQGGSSTNWKTTGTTNYNEANVIIQCGIVSIGTVNAGSDFGPVSVTFPKAFAQNPLVFCANGADGINASGIIGWGFGSSTSGFSIYGRNTGSIQATNVAIQWLAIGTIA